MQNIKNQVVLDFDLDFMMGYQTHAPRAADRQALNVSISIRKFENFLDKLCFHQSSNGLAFETHTITAKIWETLILQGKLHPPFTVVHVDAHHDIYKLCYKEKLNCGNYLVPFIENGLIDNFIWVKPNDMLDWQDADINYNSRQFKDIDGTSGNLKRSIQRILKGRNYSVTTVAFSPNYCGVKCDSLIPILASRLKPSSACLRLMRKLSKKHPHEFTRSRFYFEEVPYFRSKTDGARETICTRRLVSRIQK